MTDRKIERFFSQYSISSFSIFSIRKNSVSNIREDIFEENLPRFWWRKSSSTKNKLLVHRKLESILLNGLIFCHFFGHERMFSPVECGKTHLLYSWEELSLSSELALTALYSFKIVYYAISLDSQEVFFQFGDLAFFSR